MSSTKRSRLVKASAFTLSLVIIALSIWAILNRQFVYDQFATWSYTPSTAIESITTNTQLSSKGKLTFYATHPVVDTRESFNQACPRQEANSPILGCYAPNDRIYIYDITNQQLAGIEEVTAVHEMLHAVWKRTSTEERATLTKALKAAFATINDSQLKDRMAYYERTEPGEYANELHSILGSEVAHLGEPLESYYAQYFNRSAVLAFHDKYSNLYQSLYAQSDTLRNNMQTLATQIQKNSDTYNIAALQLSTDISSFNNRANNGNFSSRAQFNIERSALTQRSAQLEQQRTAINNDIDTYNGYYSQYKVITKQIDGLNSSIDSFAPIQAAPSV